MDSDYIPGVPREDFIRASAISNSMDAVSFDTAKDYLRNTKLSSLFPANRSQIHHVTTETPVGEAFQTLIQQKILSMPVFEEKSATFVSFIDLLDVVYFIIESLKGTDLSDASFSQQIKTSKSLSKATAGYVAGSSGRNPFYPLEESAPLMAAVQLMADNKIQRVPVVSNTARNELLTIVTQSHVTNLINDQMDKLEFRSQTVQQLSLGASSVLTVDKKDKAINAFKLIHDKKVSGVAVIDSSNNDAIYANISASDIKHIGESAEHISRLFLPLEEYLKFVCGGGAPTPLSVPASATYEDVVKQMVAKKVHRIYVVNESKQAIGVVSLTDLLIALVKNL